MKSSTKATLINISIILVLGSIAAIVFGIYFGGDPLDIEPEPEQPIVVEDSKAIVKIPVDEMEKSFEDYDVAVQKDHKKKVAKKVAKKVIEKVIEKVAEKVAEKVVEKVKKQRDAEQKKEQEAFLKRIEEANKRRAEQEAIRKARYDALVKEQMADIPIIEAEILEFIKKDLPNTSRRVVDDYILLLDDCEGIRSRVGALEKPVYQDLMNRTPWKEFLLYEKKIKENHTESVSKRKAWDDWCVKHRKKTATENAKREAKRKSLKDKIEHRKAEREAKLKRYKAQQAERIKDMFAPVRGVKVNP